MNEAIGDRRHDNPETRHERSDVSVRAILACAGGLAVVAALIHVGAWLLFDYLEARERRAKPNLFPLAAEERQRPGGLRLEGTPAPEGWSNTVGQPLPPREPRLEGIKDMEGKGVYVDADVRHGGGPPGKYGWVDRKKGIVQIPLEQAMDLIVEHNLLPARSPELGGGREQLDAWPSRANSGRWPVGRER
jgi:hypothetical protein